jgi:sulfur-oxidizing protein SoxA
MKKITLVLLLAFSLPALAEPVLTVGYEEKTPEATLKALQDYFHKKSPEIKGDAFVDGSMNYSEGERQYDKFMMDRMQGDFDQPEGYPEVMSLGKKQWETPFANGKTMASCFAHGGKGAANDYPKVDEKTGKVITFERALNDCRVANGEKPLDYDDMKKGVGPMSIVARHLSDGMRINMKIDTPAELAAFNRGKEVFYGRTGAADQSCASCHIQHAGDIARTEDLSPVIGQATHFPVFRGNGDNGVKLITLQNRYEGCQKSTGVDKPMKPNSDESNDLEYFHTYISNGLPLSTGVFRK